MRTLRLIGRGASAPFEHLIPFALLSLGWWLCVGLILPGPAATVALASSTASSSTPSTSPSSTPWHLPRSA